MDANGRSLLLGVDVGGTFTDAALYDPDRRALFTAKAPTTPVDQTGGVLEAVDSVLERAGAVAGSVAHFAHGMTVGTNALLEERGARTALVTTHGFADVIEIARQNRPRLYRPCAPKPVPLVPAELRFEVRERTGPDGVLEVLSEAELDRAVEQVRASRVEAVAICLLFSYVDETHEQAISRRIRTELPDVHVSASHEVLPRFREYERFSTTVIDAYLSPLMAGYLGRLGDAADERSLPEPVVMRSSGGVATVAEAARSGAWSVLSGPAGGAVGAALVARASADGSVLGLDMGGTSCDVCVVEGGRVRRTESRRIGGRVLQLPMVDVHTVGAGGGSIGWLDAGGALRVGPRSAGADPGPACYGQGGTEPTVTDANLVLGRLPGGGGLAGGVTLDEDAARKAVSALADQAGLDHVEAAEGIVRIANQEMSRALRVVTVERGVDPRRFALLPFGGAAGLHAAEIADELGIDRFICPQSAGVLSAVGLLAAERRRDTVRTVLLDARGIKGGELADAIEELAAGQRAGLADARIDVSAGLRYRGQAFELEVPVELPADPEAIAEAFEALHEERYGYREAGAPIELVDLMVSATEGVADLELGDTSGTIDTTSRQVRISGAWVDAQVHRGVLPAGFEAAGPAVLELPETTVLLPDGWTARVDEIGTLRAGRERS